MKRDPGAQLAAAHEQLAAQVEKLRSHDQWRQWLSIAARLHTYSFNNTLLIWAQRPEASMVAGYQAWLALGRQVTKGEKGIVVLAPVTRQLATQAKTPAVSDVEPPTRPPTQGMSRRAVVGFRTAHVFDITQTTGADLAVPPSPVLLEGAAPEGLWDLLAEAVTREGFVLGRGPLGSANGLTDFASHTVTVRPDVDDAQGVKTLIHELAHVRLHAPHSEAGVGVEGTRAAGAGSCRGVAEVEAESVAFIVAGAHGLDTSTYSIPYVAAWAGGADPGEVADVVRATGTRVLGAARWILDHAHGCETAGEDAGREADLGVEQLDANVLAGGDGSVVTEGASREVLIAAHEAAAEYYRSRLEGTWVRPYLESRDLAGALDGPWVPGYAPPQWSGLVDHLRRLGYAESVLVEAGLALRARNGRVIDRFRDRLMLAVRAPSGEIVAFVGRAHPDGQQAGAPKYLNSATTSIYTKSRILFGLAEGHEALLAGARAVLVEGPVDAIAVTLGTEGRCVGLAPCGTAISPEQLGELLAYMPSIERGIVVATDADDAGRAAAERVLAPLAALGVSPSMANLPEGLDPAGLLHQQGPAALTAALLERSRPLAEFVIDTRVARWRSTLQWVEGRVPAARDAAGVIALMPMGAVPELVDYAVGVIGCDRGLVIGALADRFAADRLDLDAGQARVTAARPALTELQPRRPQPTQLRSTSRGR